MSLTCPQCSRTLEFSGDRPLFCAYCGQRLGDPRLAETAEFRPRGEASTVLISGAKPVIVEDAPERIAGYRLIRALGHGGMGTVFEAEDSRLGRRVALKLIAQGHVSSSEAVERFRQEGRLASTISHPRCVFVLGADEEAGRPYIVMELMPGTTLQDLIRDRGPLPIGEAIAKILDVIDGLIEAHALGVIHRDVKPTNCFLDAEGRVKVGDFGLSKSLVGDSQLNLTRTGAFLGTPLYASPEQIKGDPLDPRADLYSVAATLYYLLAGRPPFEARDAAAALARIVSEQAPSLRSIRPELPRALDEIVLRGLERDRDRRYRDLAEFREALEPFLGRRLTLGSIGLRAAAYLFDALLFIVPSLAAHVALSVLVAPERLETIELRAAWIFFEVSSVAWIVYFTITEGLWGASLGKRLAGLQVRALGGDKPPGVARSGARVVVCFLIGDLASEMLEIRSTAAVRIGVSIAFGTGSLLAYAAGYLVLASTMRARNGYRGIHELVSGTRVVRLARGARRRAPRGRRMPANRPDLLRRATTRPPGVLESIGPFRVRGAVRSDSGWKVLLAEDSNLGRPVWIVLRPRGAAPPSPGRRDLSRPARPRWLDGGDSAEGRWDAYNAPSGCNLADLAGPEGLPWHDARPILTDLADELAVADADGTLPDALTVDQVWIQPDGTIQLIEPLDPARSDPLGDPTARALDLIRQASILVLEGGRRRPTAPPDTIHALMPRHAEMILARLLGRGLPYPTVAALRDDLKSIGDQPTEIDLGRRAVHLGVQALVLGPGLLMCLAVGPLGLLDAPKKLLFLAIWPAVWIIWAGLTRGGLCLRLTGMALVRGDSRPAGRFRSAGRAVLVWAPVAALTIASAWLRLQFADQPALSWLFWGLALALPPIYVALALIRPERGPHDRLAGSALVPV